MVLNQDLPNILRHFLPLGFPSPGSMDHDVVSHSKTKVKGTSCSGKLFFILVGSEKRFVVGLFIEETGFHISQHSPPSVYIPHLPKLRHSVPKDY